MAGTYLGTGSCRGRDPRRAVPRKPDNAETIMRMIYLLLVPAIRLLAALACYLLSFQAGAGFLFRCRRPL